MKRKKLYSDILNRILVNYSHLPVGSADYMDIDDNIHNEDLDIAAQSLAAAPNLPETLKPLLLTIQIVYNINNKEDEIIQEYKIVELFNKLSHEKYQRNLFYRGVGLTVVETNCLYPENINNPYSEDLWLSLQALMWKTNDMVLLVDSLAVGKRKGYVLGFTKTVLGYPNNFRLDKILRENLYAFALASFTHDKNVLPIHEKLCYDVSALAFNHFAFKVNINYLQYYDIYDVLQEWLHATDILTAFLKMYQIAEYIIYRKQMYKVVNSASLKQSFLRGVKNIDRKFNESERESIKEGLKNLFPGVNPPTGKIRKAQGFIGDYFGKTKSGKPYLSEWTQPNEMNGAIATFIYDMRCSIVHNKEAEFHMTLSNFDVYKNVIPLARYVHDEMMKKIWDFLNTYNNGIEYNNKQLDLY